MEPEVYSVNEVARLLKVSRSTAYVLVRSGQLPSVKIGAQVRIPRAALERMLEERVAERAVAAANAR